MSVDIITEIFGGWLSCSYPHKAILTRLKCLLCLVTIAFRMYCCVQVSRRIHVRKTGPAWSKVGCKKSLPYNLLTTGPTPTGTKFQFTEQIRKSLRPDRSPWLCLSEQQSAVRFAATTLESCIERPVWTASTHSTTRISTSAQTTSIAQCKFSMTSEPHARQCASCGTLWRTLVCIGAIRNILFLCRELAMIGIWIPLTSLDRGRIYVRVAYSWHDLEGAGM